MKCPLWIEFVGTGRRRAGVRIAFAFAAVASVLAHAMAVSFLGSAASTDAESAPFARERLAGFTVRLLTPNSVEPAPLVPPSTVANRAIGEHQKTVSGRQSLAAAGVARRAVSRAAMQPASAVDQSNTLEVKGREPFFLAQHYLPGRGLDRPPLPRSAPDPDYLSDVMASGLPIRLRLYIGAAGAVEQIDVLQSNPDDADAIERIKAMFFATTFVAGQQAGVEVAAYIDIQVELANPLSAASTATLFTR